MTKKMYPEYRTRSLELYELSNIKSLVEKAEEFAFKHKVDVDDLGLYIIGDDGARIVFDCMTPETDPERNFRLNAEEARKEQRRKQYEALKKEFG